MACFSANQLRDRRSNSWRKPKAELLEEEEAGSLDMERNSRLRFSSTRNYSVLLFGSFTEDEIKSFQRQPPEIDIEIKFGSLDAETLRSLGIFNSKLTEYDFSTGFENPSSISTAAMTGARVSDRDYDWSLSELRSRWLTRDKASVSRDRSNRASRA
ncbi:hypothetical protein LOK49_LG10G00442 [Camellia lanceoleosa]|uniref:Uncharacterized protein n=1 Tax=Camellia lanceoleosa TaxID=1840588 RepID=A0ACC0GAJ5_9ERIC|nr:hypothetical protein LOK49_LG10G00442 [Camellia lanceoleosa]